MPLFTELPRETVRKGYEQRSERGFGRYTEHKMDRKAPPWRPVRLRWERLRDFSDSLSGELLGNRSVSSPASRTSYVGNKLLAQKLTVFPQVLQRSVDPVTFDKRLTEIALSKLSD